MTTDTSLIENIPNIGSGETNENIDWTGLSLPAVIDGKNFKSGLQLRAVSSQEKTITFTNCRFKNINIKETKDIECFCFQNCQISSVLIFRNDVSIRMENCEVNEVVTQQCHVHKLSCENSSVQSISLESSGSVDEISISAESNIDTINCRDARVKKVSIHNSRVNRITINTSIDLLELSSGSVLERFSINDKEELQKFLRTLRKTKGSISQRKTSALRCKQILLAAYAQYEEEHKYQELDMCLLKLRKFDNYLHRLETKNPFKDAMYIIKKIVLGDMFGWGISIHNSIITSACIIGVFGGIYYIFMRDTFDKSLECATWCLNESVNRFFDIERIDAQIILPYLDNAEQIIGIIILTIFTGVLARKIIR